MSKKSKSITISIPEEMHKELKIKITKKGVLLKDYMTDLIEKDLNVKKVNVTRLPKE